MKKLPTPPLIQVTYDYDLFNHLDSNRDATPERIANLTESINEEDLTDCIPIVVNEKFLIIDGRGRYETLKRMGKPIFYVQKDFGEKSERVMIILNAYQKSWAANNYIDYYIKKEVPTFLKVANCMSMYQVSSSIAIMFVTNGRCDYSDVKSGKIKTGAIPYNRYGDALMSFKEIFKDYAHIFFVRALVYLINEGIYKHKEDFKKFVKHRASLIGCANTVQYLKMFEEIFNYRKGVESRIDIMTKYNKKK
jgi:hypothetical protein